MAAAILALLAFFVASDVAAQQPVTFFGLTFPRKIGGAQLGKSHDFEKTSPGAGYGVEYLRPGWAVHVYIYDLGLPSIPEDVQSGTVKQTFEEAKEAILRSPSYANVELKGAHFIADASLRPRFLCATLTFKRQDIANAVSLLCVTSWKNKFVKFRVTTQSQKGAETEAKSFVEAWAKVLWPAT